MPADFNTEEKVAELEALLFIHGEPITKEKIRKTLALDANALDSVLREYGARLSQSGRGLSLVAGEERVQLATKPDFSRILEKFVKEELHEELTPASIEALSIVTYLGAISRSRLEYIRGVNSSFILRTLLLRGLIERAPDPLQQSVYLYTASVDLLRHLGVAKKDDLPDYEKFRTLLGTLENRGES